MSAVLNRDAVAGYQRWEPPQKVHSRVHLREPSPTPAPPPSTKRTVGGQTGGHEQGAPRVEGTAAPKKARTKKKAPTS